MKTYLGDADILTFTAPAGGVVSGAGVQIGAVFGVAQATVAAGAPFAMVTEGRFVLPKVSAQAWTEGAKLYWDDTAKNVTTTASTNKLIGVAAAAAANPSATGAVALLPFPG